MKPASRASMLAVLAFGAAAGMSGTVVSAAPDISAAQARQDVRQAQGPERNSPSRVGERNIVAKAMLGGFGRIGRRARYPNGPGWTQAHVQRMARKRRGQQRNKRAHRG